jgi:hypothetical protein
MAASSKDIKAGGAFVEIFGDDSKLQKVLDAAQRRVQAFGKTIGNIGKLSAGAGATILAPITASFKEAVDHIGDIGTLQKKFGGSAEDVSRLAYAFKTTGVNVEDLTNLLKHLNTEAAKEADSPEKGWLHRIGIDAREFIKLDPKRQIEALAGAMRKVPLEADRIMVAQELMGRNGIESLKLLTLGADDFRERMEQAGEFGFEYSQEQIKQAKTVSRAFKELKTAATSAFLAIGEAILPAADQFKKYVGLMTDGYKEARKFLEEHAGVVRTIAMVGGGLMAGGTALILVSKGIGLIGTLIGGLLIPIKLVLAGVSLLTTAFGLMTSVVGMFVLAAGGIAAGLGAIWLTMTASGQRFQERFTGLFGNIASTASTTWTGIVEAVRQGDLKEAFEIATLGVRILWMEMVDFLEDEWKRFRAGWLEGLKETLTAAWKLVTDPDLGLNRFEKNLQKKIDDKVDRLLYPGDFRKGALGAGLSGGGGGGQLTFAEFLGGMKALGGEFARFTNYKSGAAMVMGSMALGPLDGLRDMTDKEKMKAELERRVAALFAPKPEAPGPGFWTRLIGGLDASESNGLRKVDTRALADATKSAFQSPDWKAQFGIGDKIGEQQRDLLKDVKGELQAIGAILGGMGMVRIK